MTRDEEFIEKAKSVGFVKGYKKGATKKKPVINELDGTVGGHHIEHYDGSQDAVVTPRTVGAKSDARVEGDNQ